MLFRSRAFAQHLGISHATLSSLISGKRKITKTAMLKLAKALHMSPADIARFETSASDTKSEKQNSASYFMIQQDAFAAMSEWYYDAILELSLIPRFKLEPAVIAKSIGITPLKAKIALETLERLELLTKDSKGQYKLTHQNSINILDTDFTSVANRKYQKSVLETSLEALESVERKKRDHTSTTIAIHMKDLEQAKSLIQKFRHDLNAFLQRDGAKAEEVYQLQVSFFPLSNNLNEE